MILVIVAMSIYCTAGIQITLKIKFVVPSVRNEIIARGGLVLTYLLPDSASICRERCNLFF
jgi:hypothetical protein